MRKRFDPMFNAEVKTLRKQWPIAPQLFKIKSHRIDLVVKKVDGKRGFKTKFGRKPQWRLMMKIETIYIVYENSDNTEGRGPMRHVPDSGFFTDEDAAWNFADTQCGIMGRKPQSGSWRIEKYPDVQVRAIHKHDGDYHTRKSELTSRINQLKNELYSLEQERKQDKPNAS